jgi:hypothetical protein
MPEIGKIPKEQSVNHACLTVLVVIVTITPYCMSQL